MAELTSTEGADDAVARLFVYGSLQPGGPNEHVLSGLNGQWQRATVRGQLHRSGWGAEMGYPGLVLDAAGARVEGYVLSSAGLSGLWPELDAFEGEEYARVRTHAELADGTTLSVCVYALR